MIENIVISLFVVTGSLVGAGIEQGEWFINADPGVGSGTGFSVSGTGASVAIPSSSIQSLPSGSHLLGVRLKLENGNWGHTVWRPFLRDEIPAATPALNTGEWFIGIDPGVGNGHQFSASAAEVSVEISAEQMEVLSPGVPLLGVRLRDSDAKWSHPVLRAFLKDTLPKQPSEIIGMRYQIVRAGEVIATQDVSTDTPALQIDQQVVHGKKNLLLGADHKLQVIPLDATGHNGHAANTVFSYQPYVDAWLLTHFTAEERSDPAIFGDNADPDVDGWSNAEERAFVMNPRDAGDAAKASPEIDRDENNLGISFRVPAGGTVGSDGIYRTSNLAYRLLEGGIPAATNAVPADWIESWTVTPLVADGACSLEFRLSAPPADRRFFRLQSE